MLGPRKAYHWLLDYAYVSRWQIRALFLGSLPAGGNLKKSSVVLIPGVYESWHFMWPIAEMLQRAGHPVHVIKKLGYNRSSIPEAAAHVAEYIENRGLDDVIIIAHSKGGLIAKYFMVTYGATKVRHLIAIHTPFAGSVYAYLFLLPTVRAFIPNNALIKLLQNNTAVNQKITSIYGKFDPHIPGGSFLDGARNIQLPLMGHFKIMGDRLLLRTLKEEVGRYEA